MCGWLDGFGFGAGVALFWFVKRQKGKRKKGGAPEEVLRARKQKFCRKNARARAAPSQASKQAATAPSRCFFVISLKQKCQGGGWSSKSGEGGGTRSSDQSLKRERLLFFETFFSDFFSS